MAAPNRLTRFADPQAAGPAAQPRAPRLGREDWVAAARAALISGGVEAVKVDVLARQLRVTRGSFYWHFADRAELLEALKADWEDKNNVPVIAAIAASGANGDRRDFDRHLGRLWTDERDYSPAYDSAMRDWGRTDPAVKDLVHRIDDARIAALQDMFRAYGFGDQEALIRARITYYHQVGYYALEVKESTAERDRWGPLYDKVLLY